MNNAMKRTLKIVGIAVGAVVLVFAGLTLVRNVSRQPVNVYPMTNIATQNWGGDGSTTYGTVSADGIQKVYLGERQKVLEVLVSEGDEVKAGDPLLAIDADLASLDVKKAEIAKGKAELAVQQAKSELATLNSLRPHSSKLIIPDNNVVYTPHETPFIIQGTGLKGDPFIILWGESDTLNNAYLNSLVAKYIENAAANAAIDPAPQPTDPTDGDDSDDADDSDTTERVEDDGAMYVALITRQEDALNAPITSRWGLRVSVSGSSAAGFSFYTPTLPAAIEAYTEIPQPYYEDTGSFYTAAELAQLRAEKRQEVTRLEIEARLAAIEYERIAQEGSDGYIRATIDGVVTSIGDTETADANTPAVTVSAGGGYTVTGTMSEFDLATVKVGQEVTLSVYDWSQGGQFVYYGTITSISQYPTTQDSYYNDGNPNISNYPFTVFVDGSANLSSSSYVEITYGSADSGNNFYLPNAFIRTDSGNSYVYVQGEDGKLEKRTVQLGRDLWGSYTQILSGVSWDDYIAFPYGTDVTEGAKTKQQEDMTALYGGYYY